MGKKRQFISLAAVLLAVMLLVGCGGGTKAPVNAQGTAAPQSGVPGYYSVGQSVSGGKDMQYINLRDIKVTKQATDTVIQMEFKEGSLLRDMVEKPTEGVPKYSTQWIGGVDRLVININGLAFWDYRVYDDELKDTPILSIFNQTPVNDTEAMLTKLYINLKSDIVYKIEEKDNFLILSFRALPEEEKTSYYVMVNAFDEYSEGIVGEDQGLFPTMCNDKINMTLISKPFATEEEANSFMEEKKGSLLPLLPGKELIVKPIKNGELPVFDEKGALTAYQNATVTRSGGAEQTAPVLTTNGKLLCWRPDGMAYVYVTPFFMASDGSEPISYEKIYINDLKNNTPTLLTDFDYSSITKAEFSSDGRFLAFLVGNDENRLLCIYDFEDSNKQVATASEAGFGADTANFTWGTGDKAHTIYAITGEGNTLQLMSYTPTTNGPVVETLVENAFTDGSMGFFEGKLYYSQTSPEDNTQNGIFSFDVAGKQTKRVCDGEYFELNGKTGAMAIITGDNREVKIYSIRSDLMKSIIKGKDVYTVVWSNDGASLYYLLYKYDTDSASTDRFSVTLYQYDPRSSQSKEITDTIQGQFMQSDKSSEVLLTYIYTQDDRFVPITYRVAVGGN